MSSLVAHKLTEESLVRTSVHTSQPSYSEHEMPGRMVPPSRAKFFAFNMAPTLTTKKSKTINLTRKGVGERESRR